MLGKLVITMNENSPCNKNKFWLKKKKVLVFVIFLIIVSIVYLGWSRFYDIRRGHKLILELDCVGNILMLFAEDNGRMPSSFDELVSKGYLKKEDENNYVAGNKSKNRSAEWGLKPSEVTIQFLGTMKLGDGKTSQALQCDEYEVTKRSAKTISNRLDIYLNPIDSDSDETPTKPDDPNPDN